MWHRFVRWVARHGLRWIYRDIVVVGAERVPRRGPVLLIANHPNDLADVLIGYLVSGRDVRYVATISAATSSIARAVFRGLGVIPVTRIRDARRLLQQGADLAEVNRAAYRRVQDAWGQGHLVSIFPEGGVWAGSDLGPFRAGAARMVQQCLDDGGTESLEVVCIGVQYERLQQAGSDVFVQIGEPFKLDKTVTSDGNAAPLLTRKLHSYLRAHVRHADTLESRTQLDVLIGALGASLASHSNDALLMAGRIGPVVCESARLPHAGLTSMLQHAKELGDYATRVGGRPESARDLAELHRAALGDSVKVGPRTPFSALQRASLPAVVALTPLALLGWIVHAPVFVFIWRMAAKRAESAEHRVAKAFLPGIYIVLVWFLVVSGLVATGLSLLGRSPLYAFLVIPSFFLLGDISSEWRHALSLIRLRFRANRLPPQDMQHICELFDQLRASSADVFALPITRFASGEEMHSTEHPSVNVQVIA